MPVQAILIHGMGRTPLSMRPLAAKLRRSGIQTHSFGYSATIEKLEGCRARFKKFIHKKAKDQPYILIGHSLGSVIIRSTLESLSNKPLACFLLSPPIIACRVAKFVHSNFLYRALTGQMGQLLSDKVFMNKLTVPDMTTVIYAGTAGPRHQWLPFQEEYNDGILSLSEMTLPPCRTEQVKAVHSLIMFSDHVARDIVATVVSLKAN